jgi:HEAT repeat protein
MIMTLKPGSLTRWVVLLATVSAACGQTVSAADDSPAEKQRKLLEVLQSGAPPQDKAMACKRLAVYGAKEAVPALAPLLADEDLASWARIALEAIPDAAADDALREAAGKLQRRLLIGVVNSIGVRRDAKAVAILAAKLRDADAEVASAAAVALGKIGGPAAAKALEPTLANAANEARSAVAEGCILCAEKSLAGGKAAEATRLYDAVRRANVPKPRLLEATRGAILARQAAGMPLLIEQLRSADKDLLYIGLRVARELPGRTVTEALAAELKRANPDRQTLLLMALGDRRDPAVLPAALAAAGSGSPKLRTVAVGLLERLGDPSAVPALLEAAADSDAELAKTAKTALSKLEDKEVDAALLARLPQAKGTMRQVLIELAGRRQIRGALSSLPRLAEDADAQTRRVAVEAIGVLGQDQQAADLVRLLQKTESANEREDIRKALAAICGRCGARCTPHLLPLARSSASALRIAAVQLLASVGGPEALGAVTKALDDPDEVVQDEAVGALAAWPNNWPEDAGVAQPLLALAKSGRKTAHQVQGVRGYLQYVQETKKLDNSQKLARLNELLPLVQRAEEKRLAIPVISSLPVPGALELLQVLAQDQAVAEEACLGLVNLAGARNLRESAPELCQKALQTVVEKSKSDATRQKAEALLKETK